MSKQEGVTHELVAQNIEQSSDKALLLFAEGHDNAAVTMAQQVIESSQDSQERIEAYHVLFNVFEKHPDTNEQIIALRGIQNEYTECEMFKEAGDTVDHIGRIYWHRQDEFTSPASALLQSIDAFSRASNLYGMAESQTLVSGIEEQGGPLIEDDLSERLEEVRVKAERSRQRLDEVLKLLPKSDLKALPGELKTPELRRRNIARKIGRKTLAFITDDFTRYSVAGGCIISISIGGLAYAYLHNKKAYKNSLTDIQVPSEGRYLGSGQHLVFGDQGNEGKAWVFLPNEAENAGEVDCGTTERKVAPYGKNGAVAVLCDAPEYGLEQDHKVIPPAE